MPDDKAMPRARKKEFCDQWKKMRAILLAMLAVDICPLPSIF